MKVFNLVIIFLIFLLLSACAGNVDDPYTNVRAKTQCPIGYHLEQTNALIIFNNEKDKDKEKKSNTRFNCVADSDVDIRDRDY